MIKLQKLNVVKLVAEEFEAEALERKGFKRVAPKPELEKETKGKAKKPEGGE
ncbi:hypothetical protein [Paenibacillus barengoltzii]|uniref:hypothetical protein n=1 Tax=Paenibacillus barengoltzii TaxID=343517 RepID=UPI0013E0BEC7|nr:hypothetical protein [Paenibacillus barengoltzii]